jgi:hypothetical protein
VSGRGRGGDATNRGLRSTLILLAVLLVTGAAACSSDDDEAAPAATTSPPVREHRDLLLRVLRGTGTVTGTVDGHDVEAQARYA